VPSRSFGKARRVRRRGEFQKIFDTGYRVSSRYFTILFAPGGSSAPRLGIVASRKLGDAVRRNRAKRLIREVFRHLDAPSAAVDLVVIPRRELFDAPFTDLERDFKAAWQRGSSRVPARDAGERARR
jgi:ribonuclease P protein component